MVAGQFKIAISKSSDVPIRRQLAEQIVYLIATEKLEPGTPLPSVRELARRLKIHHNTVSEVYQELVQRKWLKGRRGSRLLVLGPGHESDEDLDGLINRTIRAARERGYSLQELRSHVRERLMAQPPDHILIVEEEAGLRRVIEEELRAAGRWPVQGCSRQELAVDPARAIGALIATPQYALADIAGLAPKVFPAVPLAFSDAGEHLRRVRELRKPSVVAVVSVSPAFLAAARSVLAPALGERHSFMEYLAPLANSSAALDGTAAADIVFCDTVTRGKVPAKNHILYRLVAKSSIKYLMSAMESYQNR
jgi:DNA-binding transcriptional regulator YhcF (GntR family)